jgi:Y_Y_Y domain
VSIGKRLITVIFLLGALVLVAPSVSGAIHKGWQPPRQLAWSPDRDTRVNSPSICVDGDHVMVAYQQKDMIFIDSVDGGKTWSKPVSISGGSVINRFALDSEGSHLGRWRSFDLRPAIYFNRGDVIVAWHSYDQSRYKLFLNYRNRAGVWSKPRVINEDSNNNSFNPRFVKTRRGLFLFWYEINLPPKGIGRTLPSISTDTLIDPDGKGAGAIRSDVDIRGMGKVRNKELSISVYMGTLNLSKQLEQSRIAVFNPRKMDIPEVFMAFADDSDNLYCALDENSEILARIYRQSTRKWTPCFDFPFLSAKRRSTMRLLDGRLHRLEADNASTAILELWKAGKARPILISDPVDIESTPDFWMSRGETHVVWGKQQSESSWIAYIRTDTVPPAAKFIDPISPAAIDTSSFWIRWTGEDDISPFEGLQFRWRISDGEWSEIKRWKGMEIEAPPDRTTPYKIEVMAIDEAGNVQKKPDVLLFDVSAVPPETFITGGRRGVVVSRSHTFTWSGQDNTSVAENLRYSYKLDNKPDSKFLSITSHTLTDLTEGKHTFSVRARDAKYNSDASPAEYTFSIALGIEPFFTAAPITITNQDSFLLKWDCRDDTEDNVRFQYMRKVDNGDWSLPFSPSEFNFTSLSEGMHTVSVRAKDRLGNTGKNDLSHSFTVDLTAPETGSIAELMTNDAHEPIITLRSKDNFTSLTSLNYLYSFDGISWTPVKGRDLLILTGKPVRFWDMGYKIYLTSVDEAGNQDQSPSIADYTFLNRDKAVSYTFLGSVALLFISIIGVLLGRTRRKRPKMVLDEEEDMFGTKEDTQSGFTSIEDEDLFSSPSDTTSSDTTSASSSDDDDDLFS